MREVMIAPVYSASIQNFEDGIFKLLELQGEVIQTMQAIKDKQKALVMQRFKQGAILCAFAQSGEEYTMDQVSQATGISVRVLFEAKQFYLSPRFGQSMHNVELWFDEQEQADKPANWVRIRNLIKSPEDTDEARAAAIDRRAQSLEKKAQEIEFEAEQFERDVIQFQGSPHVKEQALGVITKATQAARENRDKILLMADAKPERIENRDYLEFIKTQPCIITGAYSVDPHHFLTGGMGTKGSDFATIPLTREMHDEYHRIGKDSWCSKYGVDLWREMARLMHMYFVGVEPELRREAA